MYLLQIVYGFVLTFPEIKWFLSPLGKHMSVILQLCLFSIFENITLGPGRKAATKESDAGKSVCLAAGEQEKWSDGFSFLCN